jgi:hypothetical protein
VPPRTRRLLLLALAPFVLATGIGLILLWPGTDEVRLGAEGPRPEQFKASVTEVTPRSCPDVPG